jgi:hypothetical protein
MGPAETYRRSGDAVTRSTKPTLLLAGLALALACGRGPETAPGDAAKLPPLEACKLLPYDEADPGGADGLLPTRSEVDLKVGDDFAKCMYSTVELPPRSVALELRRFAEVKRAAGAQAATVDYLPRLSGAEVEPVAGVGDEAAWAGGKLNQLHARAGDLRLLVTVEVGEPETRRERAAAIARRALERLATVEADLPPPD